MKSSGLGKWVGLARGAHDIYREGRQIYNDAQELNDAAVDAVRGLADTVGSAIENLGSNRIGRPMFDRYRRRSRKRTRSKSSKRRSSSKKKPSKKKRRTSEKPKKVKKISRTQIEQLKCMVKQATSVEDNYTRNISGQSCPRNSSTHGGSGAMTVSTLTDVISNLKHFDPTNPGTLLTVDGDSGTFSRNYCMDSVQTKLTIKNVSAHPAHVVAYLCEPKESTNISAQTAFLNGISNDPGSLSTQDYCVYLTHSSQFNDLWKISKRCTKVLDAGQQFTCSHVFKQFWFDPSTVDEQSDAYQKRYNGFQWVVRSEGLMATNEAISTAGTGEPLLFKDHSLKIRVVYDGGANIHVRNVTDNASLATDAHNIRVNEVYKQVNGPLLA